MSTNIDEKENYRVKNVHNSLNNRNKKIFLRKHWPERLIFRRSG
jgi:hypothetical protein